MRTSIHYSIKSFLSLFLFLWSMSSTMAHETTYITKTTRTDINTNTSMGILSPKYIQNDPNLGVEYVQKYKAVIALVYGREALSDVTTANTWSYTIEYDLINKDNGVTIGSGTVLIKSSNTEGIYEDVEIHENVSGNIQIQVTNITANTNVPDDIRLELRLIEERYDYLDPTMVPLMQLSGFTPNTKQEITAKWPYFDGAEYYELEWGFWDDENKEAAPRNIEDLFKNAIRVKTSENQYKVDIVYPSGLLYFRVRPVGRFVRNNIDNNIEKRGKWSGKYVAHTTGFEPDKNWDFGRSYAEDGKYKQVISYFDDGLKGRQVLTNLSSENITLVAENIYDVENRASLSIMPVPVKNNNITAGSNLDIDQYATRLISTGGINYNRTTFDKHNTTSPTAIPALDDNHFANQYYSNPTNPDPFDGHINREYVPDAEGYPMAQIKYMNDGTGRIRKQSSVGSFYKLESGYETEFFYSNPTTTELQRMFGQNVGEAKYYRKNYGVDANGQIRVSYIDQAGQVIATALAGGTPDNVLPLDGTVETRLESLMGGNKFYDLSRTSEVTHQIFCDQPQIYKFTYDLEQAANIYNAGAVFCIGCSYDLEVSVVDEFGAIIPISLTTANPDVSTLGGTLYTFYESNERPCTGEEYVPTKAPLEFEVNFASMGNYTIRKTLTVVGPDVDNMLNTLQNNGTVLDQTTFINDYITFNFDSTECTPCSDALAFDLSSTLVLIDNPGLDITNPEGYQAAVDNYINSHTCAELRELYMLSQTYGEQECEGLLEQLKAQISPGGCLYETGGFYTSVFVADGETMPQLTEYSPSGTPTILPTSSSSNFADILEDNTRWQEHWADDLVQFHPEYCRYLACGDPDIVNSKLFDYNMAKLQNWMDAANAYNVPNISQPITDADRFIILLKILNNSDPSTEGSGGGASSSPLGIALANYCTYQCSIAANLVVPQPCNCGSSTSAIDFLAIGGPMGSQAPVTDGANWARFRGIYQSEKLKIHYQNQCALDYPTGFTPAAYPSPNHCTEVFGEPTVNLSNGGTPISVGFLNGITTVDQIQDAIATNIMGGTSSSSLCGQLCEDRSNDWIEDPNLCQGLTAIVGTGSAALQQDYADLKGALEDYCLDGCGSTDNNPLGYLLADDLLVPPVHPDLAIAKNALLTIQNTHGLCTGVTLSDIDVNRLDVYQPFTSYNNPAAGLPISGQKRTVIENVLTTINPLFPVSFSSIGGTNYTTMSFTHPNINVASPIVIARMTGIPSSSTYNNSTINTALTNLTGDAYYDNWMITGITLNNEHNYNTIDGSFNFVNRFIEIQGTNFCQTCSSTNNCNTLSLEFITSAGQNINPMEIFSIGAYDFNTNTVEITLTDAPCAYPNNTPGTNATACPGNVQLETMDVFVRVNNTPCSPEWEPQHGWIPITDQVSIDPDLAQAQCDSQQIAELTIEAQQAYQNYLNSLVNQMLLEDRCLDIAEKFTIEFQSTEQHYTLYYYDAMGDLVQTIPPAAVELLDASPSSTDFTDGILNANVHPNHDEHQFTKYRYNSLGQIVAQESPDGGLTKFYYDYAQRLRLSQNARQAPNHEIESTYGTDGSYAYTKFDAQGRITEVGRLKDYAINSNLTELNDIDFPQSNLTLDEKTITEYDNPVGLGNITQNNLRSRISRTYNEHIASYYDYDVHGNVKKIQHQIEKFGVSETAYEYDLITGNVNEVAFQKGTKDQFFHRYMYDADNRLTKALTSKNGMVWDKEARYFYYAHGPIARVEVGTDEVQGMDYYYNLQGWLKGLNNTTVSKDLGLDGYVRLTQNDNQWFGKDETAFYLGYHKQDYKSIGGNDLGVMDVTRTTPFDNDILGTGSVKGLYNGNIAFMITHIPALGVSTEIESKAMVYQYDALHRIKAARSYSFDISNDKWARDINGERYDTEYTYDKNGNLSTLKRWSTGQSTPIDDLDYIPNLAEDKINQLDHVKDVYSTPALSDDIEAQAGQNYAYDPTGSLISDASQSITKIQWNLMNKIDRVVRSSGGNIDFTYDAAGSRLTKKTYLEPELEETTVYIRDAGGNILATYKMVNEQRTNLGETAVEYPLGTSVYSKSLNDVTLYGASRVGVRNFDTYWKSYVEIEEVPSEMSKKVSILSLTQWEDASTRGDKLYELSNHLGNVLATVSDKKIGIDNDNNGIAEYYQAIVRSASDYYPFGWQMPNRRLNPNAYTYGFNGQLTDPEWMGGQSVAFEFRTQDPRLGRFLSTDPLTAMTPWESPYAFAGNNPVLLIDLLGLGVDNPTGSPPAKKGGGGNIISFGSMANIVEDAKDPPTKDLYEGRRHQDQIERHLGKTYRTVPGQAYRYHTGSKGHDAGWMKEEDYFKMFLNEVPRPIIEVNQGLISEVGVDKGAPIEFHNSNADKTLVVQMVRSTVAEIAMEQDRRFAAAESFKHTGTVHYFNIEFEIIEFIHSGGLSLLKHIISKGGRSAVSRLRNVCRCGGICFVGGTKVLTIDSLENIENLELGQLVVVSLEHSEIPDKFTMTASNDAQISKLYQTSIDVETWQAIKMYIAKSEGDTLFIELLRPDWWIAEHINNIGDEVYISLAEMEIGGDAVVTEIGQPNIVFESTENNTKAVIGKFINRVDGIFNLYYEGLEKPIGITAKHPVWSVTRSRWVDAENLKINELAKTTSGIIKLVKKEYIPETYVTYNIEVHDAHNYYVSDSTILVHNTGGGPPCEYLYHFTSKKSYDPIFNSKILNPSRGEKNARHGVGQYFTDIEPSTMTRGEVSYRLFGRPIYVNKITHFFKIDVRGLNIIKNKPFNFLHLSEDPLNIEGRIIESGKSIFKPKK